ncbi:hypothetical protein [Flagellimonas allohymeniacidonis]|uniref:hypothetical protein n=1 Tax=Flagellimonas allohymeniacidonis TaxID=2517819 RepID=UPI001F0DA309|nr:hypothetical protein [Allomuricauda hymeniacidonis]
MNQKNGAVKEIKEILSEIILLTNQIELEYPELYKFLEEQPMTIPAENNPKIDRDTLEDYMNGLRQLLEHYVEEHQLRRV